MQALSPYPAQGYYRVSVKALVFDNDDRLMVFKDQEGLWEMPGGGWNHDEDYLSCLKRELAEEVGAVVEEAGPIAFFYRGFALRGHPKVCLALPVRLARLDSLVAKGDGIAEVRFVTKETFTSLPFQKGEAVVQEYADQIWQTNKYA